MRAIDENALLEAINELPFTMSIYANSIDCRTARETKERIVAVIREAPTLSPDDVRPVGKWIALEPEIGLYGCSRCEHKILRAECNYCPSCGARMKGAEDG